jgi:hypothetical protein
MKLTQILREIALKERFRLPSDPEGPSYEDTLNRLRPGRLAAADAQYDAIQKSKSKYKKLTQAIEDVTRLSVSSGEDGMGNDGIFFYDKIEWGRGNGPALKAKILPILQGEFGKDAKFIFNDYYPGEPGERNAEKASITLPKT